MQTTRSTVRLTQLAMLALSVALLPGCYDDDGIDFVEAPAPAPQSSLTLVANADQTYASAATTSGDTVAVFRDADGTATQASYSNPATGERVRIFYGSDGLPTRIYDEVSGSSLTINRVSTERVDFTLTDAQNHFVAGYALFNADGAFSVAPILGTPAFTGQLVGQITGSIQSGSFSVLPATAAGLGTEAAISPQAETLSQALAQTTTAQSASRMHALSAHDQAIAALGVDQRAVLAGLAAGVFLGVDAAPGSGLTASLISAAILAYGMQNFLFPVVDGERQPDTLDTLPATLIPLFDRFSRGSSALDAVKGALGGFTATVNHAIASRAFDAARDLLVVALDVAALPAVGALPPIIATALSGFGVDQSGTTYDYAGDVQPGGAVTLTGTAGTAQIAIAGTLDGDGGFTGTATGALGDGPVGGGAGDIAPCASLLQSGGQGTFSYAIDVVATTGSVTFFREAFTIPDEFRVISNGQTLYTTNGLVSGNETVTLTLNGSRTVFVNVNAPNSGTQWQFQLGCPGS